MKKIYRLEIWAEFSERSDIHNWAYRPLSDFYTDPSELEKKRQEMIEHYNELDRKYCYFEDGSYNDNGVSELFRVWEKYLTDNLCPIGNGGARRITNTHANMPEVNEYILHE